MNTIFPNNTPLGPPSTTLGGGFTLTEQSVRQFEGMIEPKWDNIQDIPADLAPSGRVRIGAEGETIILDEGGTSSVRLSSSRALGAFVNSGKLGGLPNVVAFGADPTGVVDSTAAFEAAIAESGIVFVPAGRFRISGLSMAGRTIIGAGSDVTTLTGDGDLLVSWEYGNLRGVFIENDQVFGKLITVPPGADLGASKIDNCSFGKSNYHIYAPRLCVGWSITETVFNSAAIASRYFDSVWAYRERGCYTSFNGVGWRTRFGQTISFRDSVFEYQTGEALRFEMDTDGQAVNAISFDSVHFEGNGSATDGSSILLQTTAPGRIRNVQWKECSFMVPRSAPYVQLAIGGGGNIDKMAFRDSFLGGDLITPGFNHVLDNCEQSGGTATPDAFDVLEEIDRRAISNDAATFTDVTAPAFRRDGGGALVGTVVSVGVSAGGGAIQAQVTPPGDAQCALIIVQGDSYSGTAGANDGALVAVWSVSGGHYVTLVDHDSTLGGGLQGFTVATEGGQIVVRNKVGMSANQSGRTTVQFFGA